MEMSIGKLSLRIKLRLIETVDVCDSSVCRSKSLMLFFPRSGGKAIPSVMGWIAKAEEEKK